MNVFKKQIIKNKLYFKKESRKLVDIRETKAKSLVLKLIKDSKSSLKIYPHDNTRIIINNDIKVFIDHNSLSFFNNQSYLVKLCQKNHDLIIKLFDEKLMSEFSKLEEEKNSSLYQYFQIMYNKFK